MDHRTCFRVARSAHLGASVALGIVSRCAILVFPIVSQKSAVLFAVPLSPTTALVHAMATARAFVTQKVIFLLPLVSQEPGVLFTVSLLSKMHLLNLQDLETNVGR